MPSPKLFEINEILTLASGLVALVSYLWMKLKVPGYRLEHLRSPAPLLGLVSAYRSSSRPEVEKSWVIKAFRGALVVFLSTAVISFAAGFIAAVRGPGKIL